MKVVLFAIFVIMLIGSGYMNEVNSTYLCHNRVCSLFSNESYHRREDLEALAPKAVTKAGAHLDNICEEKYSQFNVSLETNEASFFGNMFFAAIGCLSRCDFVLLLIGEISKRGALTRDTRVHLVLAVIAIAEGVVILLAVILVAVMVVKRYQNGHIERNGSRSADWGTQTSDVQDADNHISTLPSVSRSATPEEGHLTITVEFCVTPMASQVALLRLKRHLSEAVGVHAIVIAQTSCARTHCASLSSVHEDMETNATSDRLRLDHAKGEQHTRRVHSGDPHPIGPQLDIGAPSEPRSATPEEGDLPTAAKCCTPPTTSQVALPQQKRHPSEKDHPQHTESDQCNRGSPARIVEAARVRQAHTEDLGDTRSCTPEEGTECGATPTASQVALPLEIQYLLGAAGSPPHHPKPSLPGPHSYHEWGECGGALSGAHQIGFTRSGVHYDHRKPKSAFAQTSSARRHRASQSSVHEERETSGRAGVHGLLLDHAKGEHHTRRVHSGAPHPIGPQLDIGAPSEPRSATPEESTSAHGDAAPAERLEEWRQRDAAGGGARAPRPRPSLLGHRTRHAGPGGPPRDADYVALPQSDI